MASGRGNHLTALVRSNIGPRRGVGMWPGSAEAQERGRSGSRPQRLGLGSRGASQNRVEGQGWVTQREPLEEDCTEFSSGLGPEEVVIVVL